MTPRELSPRARGRPDDPEHRHVGPGAIPAYAGGRPDLCAVRFRGAGVELSPHARGRHQLRLDDDGRHGVIPVCAGADQCLMIRPSSVQGLSPHAQDRLVPHSGHRLRHGAIPTCAGPAPGPRSSRTKPWNYPRVRETDCRPGDAAGRRGGVILAFVEPTFLRRLNNDTVRAIPTRGARTLLHGIEPEWPLSLRARADVCGTRSKW
jgi:hypothetical protein